MSRAWRLNCGHACAFGRVDEAVSGGKPPAGKGVVGLLSWHGSNFWACITTFSKVRHGDSVTKPDYYYYIILWHYILAWASRTSRNSSVHKILLRGPSHKLQSISTSLQFSKISTGSLSLDGLSIKFLFSLSRPSWMASPLICINILYLRHIIHQPDHPRLLLFSFQEPEHRLVSVRSLLLLQGYGTHCLLLYAQQRPFLLFDLNSKLTSSKLPFLPRLFSLLPDWYYGLMHWVIHVWAAIEWYFLHIWY